MTSSTPNGFAAGVTGTAAGASIAAVLVSPLLQERQAVAELERLYGVEYQWSEPSLQVARRLDFVARAPEIAANSRAPTLLIVGEKDEPEIPAVCGRPARRARRALRRAGGRRLETIPGMPTRWRTSPAWIRRPRTSTPPRRTRWPCAGSRAI
jgi:pimeloyl-ACP methyl ester carboxylesterase